MKRLQGKMFVCRCALDDLFLYAGVIEQERAFEHPTSKSMKEARETLPTDKKLLLPEGYESWSEFMDNAEDDAELKTTTQPYWKFVPHTSIEKR